MDYNAIDWQVDKPGLEDVVRDWERTVITVVEPTDSRLLAVAKALEGTHVNGGAEVAQFRIDAVDAVFWFLSRNRLAEMNFFTRFFSDPRVMQAFPLISAPNSLVEEFQMEGSFTAIGRLAETMSGGGAYVNMKGRDAEVSSLASDLAQGAFAGQYSATTAWVNWRPWCEWFCDIAWDGTFVFFDKAEGLITVLIFTDTD